MKYIIYDITKYNSATSDKNSPERIRYDMKDIEAFFDTVHKYKSPGGGWLWTPTFNMQLDKARDELERSIFSGYIIVESTDDEKHIKVVESKNATTTLINRINEKRVRFFKKLCKKYNISKIETFDDENNAKLYLEILMDNQ